MSEQDGYNLSRSEQYDLSARQVGCTDMRLSSKRHETCYSCYDDCLDAPPYCFADRYVGGPRDPHKLARKRLDIGVLRVCRQLYIEANQVLWRTTTWSFTHALAFSQFMDRRNALQRRLMRKLHLDLDPRYCWVMKNWAEGWYAALHKRVLSKFTSLQVLHLDIRENQYGPRHADIIGQPAHYWWPNVAMDELVELQFLPLRDVTVTCMETSKCDRWPEHSRMNFRERLAMADAIRGRLLDYQGKEAQLRLEKERVARRMKQEQERQQRRLEQNQREGRDVVEKQLQTWTGQCPLCYVRQCQDWEVDTQHLLKECPDELKDLVIEEVGALDGIHFDQSASCYKCGVAQEICMRWEKATEGSRYFQEVGSECQYPGIVRPVIAAIMVVGPLEVVERRVYARMKAKGIWGEEEKLDAEEIKQVKQEMLLWFGQKANCGFMEASVLLQVFYWLAVGLEEWRRNN